MTEQLGLAYREYSFINQVDPDKHKDLETSLAQALDTTLPLVALGEPGEHIGSGRIKTDDISWKPNIDLLLTNASLIVMISSQRTGTK